MRPLPHDAEREAAVLGQALLRGSLAGVELRVDDFHLEQHRTVFEAMLALERESKHIDLLALEAKLRAREETRLASLEFLNRLGDKGPLAANLPRQVTELRRLGDCRRVVTTALELADEGRAPDLREDYVDFAEGKLLEATRTREMPRLRGPKQLAAGGLQAMARRAKGEVRVIPTPWPDLNRVLGNGLRPGHLVIVAGRPGMGKSALAVDLARYASTPLARDAIEPRVLHPTIVFSLEMAEEELVDRVYAAESAVFGSRIRLGRFDKDDGVALERAGRRIAAGLLHVDDTSSPTVREVVSRLRRFRANRDLFPAGGKVPGLAVLDYLQLVRGGDKRYESREQEVAAVSRGLKAAAKDLDLCVVAVCPLNRQVEGRPNKRPCLADLRESGQIEYDADEIMFMYREEYYMDDTTPSDVREKAKGVAECILAKQRGGGVGTVKLHWQAEVTRFESLQRGAP